LKIRFGAFELNEAARSLTLGGEEQVIQPRVFDLICYLVNNAGRVIPKDELMDALWPGVTVTESSLQRAASLVRQVLAAGSLEGSIQNFAKRGYRFALDDAKVRIERTTVNDTDQALQHARDAVRKRDWIGGSSQFAALAASAELGADDLELWALADECRGRPVNAIPALSRAIEIHLTAGNAARGGRAAVTLAKIELERSSGAVAQGWIDRAQSILANCEDNAAHAYLLWLRSRMATTRGHSQEALALATRANELAETTNDEGLRALTLVYRGFFQMSLGDVEEGSRLQNHAAAIALSSQVDPIVGSLIYCNILWSCRTFADWERALQWSDGFETWCTATFAESPGACDLHRAEVLGVRATLPVALAKITQALPKLSAEESWSIGEGYRVRGDVAAMLGNLSQAESDYATAYAIGWDAEPGHAVLLFERGDVDGALAALERALAGQSWFHLQRRGVLLANAARIAALAGRAERAERYLNEVEAAGERWSQPAIRALTAEAKAALLPPDDRHVTQIRLLARQLWTSAKFDYHVARVRIDLARAFVAAGDVSGAQTELSAAEHLSRRIESPRLLDACAALRQLIAAASAPAVSVTDKLKISAR